MLQFQSFRVFRFWSSGGGENFQGVLRSQRVFGSRGSLGSWESWGSRDWVPLFYHANCTLPATCDATRICQFITNNHASFHVWWKKNFLNHQEVSKYFEHDCSWITFLNMSITSLCRFKMLSNIKLLRANCFTSKCYKVNTL